MDRKGFMLLEVLVTLVILSTSLVLIVQSIVSSLRGFGSSAYRIEHLLMLDNRMIEAISGKCLQDHGVSSKIQQAYWRLEKVNEFLNIYKVRISLNENKLFLETYVFKDSDYGDNEEL